MNGFVNKVKRYRQRSCAWFAKSIGGASLVEMGMVLGLIAVGSVGTVMTLGYQVEDIYCKAARSLGSERPCDESLVDGSEQEGPSFADGLGQDGFVSWSMEMGATDPQPVMLALTEPTTASTMLSIVATDFPIEACYQALESDPLTCGASSSSSSIVLPSGVGYIGYRTTPPAEIRDVFSQDLQISYINEVDDELYWEITVDRPRTPVVHNPDMMFGDEVFAAGTVSDQVIMEIVDGNFNGILRFRTNPGGARYASCLQALEADQPVCEEFSSGVSEITLSPNSYAVGYVVELPEDPTADFSDTLGLDLMSDYDPSRIESWTVNLSRVPEGVEISDSFEFADVTLTAGTTHDHTEIIQMTGYNNTPMRLIVSPSLGGNPRSCYVLREGDDPVCAANSGDGNIVVPSNAWGIGYRIGMGTDKWVEDVRSVDISLTSEVDVSQSRNWSDVTITSPAAEATFDLAFNFDDYQFPIGATGTHYIMKPWAGSDVNDTVSMTVDAGNIRMRATACRQEVEDGPMDCGNVSAGKSSIESDPSSDYAIGYRIEFCCDPALSAASNTPVITMETQHSVIAGRSWSPVVSRPAGEVIVAPTYAWTDQLNAEFGVPLMIEKTGEFNDEMTLRVTASPKVRFAACKRVNEGDSLSCSSYSSNQSTSSTMNVNPSDFEVGFDVFWGYYGAGWSFDSTITFELISKSDNSVKNTQTFRFTRN